MEAHGGRIRAESGGPGQGTRFTFTLPADEDAARAPGAARGPSLPTGRGCGVLVAGDRPHHGSGDGAVISRAEYHRPLAGIIARLNRNSDGGLSLLDGRHDRHDDDRRDHD